MIYKLYLEHSKFANLQLLRILQPIFLHNFRGACPVIWYSVKSTTTGTDLYSWIRIRRESRLDWINVSDQSRVRNTSVADPGCFTRITDPNFSIPDPGSKRFQIPDPHPHQRMSVFLTPKTISKLSENVQECSSRIRIFFTPGSRGLVLMNAFPSQVRYYTTIFNIKYISFRPCEKEIRCTKFVDLLV